VQARFWLGKGHKAKARSERPAKDMRRDLGAYLSPMFFPLQSDHVKQSTGCVDMVHGIDASALGLRPGAQVNDD
jgi:hypothetical protein